MHIACHHSKEKFIFFRMVASDVQCYPLAAEKLANNISSLNLAFLFRSYRILFFYSLNNESFPAQIDGHAPQYVIRPYRRIRGDWFWFEGRIINLLAAPFGRRRVESHAPNNLRYEQH